MRRTRNMRTGWMLGLAALPLVVAACEGQHAGLPGPAADQLDGAARVPEDLLPREGGAAERIAVSAGGDTIFGALRYGDGTGGANDSRLVRWEWDGERWAGPEELHFTREGAGDSEVALAPDGSYLLFSSARQTGQIGAGGRDLWLSQRQGSEEDAETEAGWSDPWMVPRIHSPVWEGGPTLSMAGNLYFSTERDDATPGRDLHVARLEGGRWTTPSSLDVLNTPGHEIDPWVAPDESLLLFASNRDEGDWDLYISFSEDAGETWTEPSPLQSPVASEADERAPALSSTGEVLFFTRDGELWWAPSRDAGAERPM